jgi:hypothetical protein
MSPYPVELLQRADDLLTQAIAALDPGPVSACDHCGLASVKNVEAARAKKELGAAQTRVRKWIDRMRMKAG